MGTGAPSRAVKWPRRKADYSPASTAKFKNAWSYTASPHTPFFHAEGKSFTHNVCVDAFPMIIQ